MHREFHDYSSYLCTPFIDKQIQKSGDANLPCHSLGRGRQTGQDTLTPLCWSCGETFLGVFCMLADLSKQLHGHIQAQNILSLHYMEQINTLAPPLANQYETQMSS